MITVSIAKNLPIRHKPAAIAWTFLSGSEMWILKSYEVYYPGLLPEC